MRKEIEDILTRLDNGEPCYNKLGAIAMSDAETDELNFRLLKIADKFRAAGARLHAEANALHREQMRRRCINGERFKAVRTLRGEWVVKDLWDADQQGYTIGFENREEAVAYAREQNGPYLLDVEQRRQ
jgi:hypothetical protein